MIEKHLCIVIERHTKKSLGVEYEIEAENWYYARHIAAARFRDNYPKYPADWCIDSIRIDDISNP